MPLTDVNQVTTSLNALQLRDVATSSSVSSHHVIAVGRQVKQVTMNSPTCVLGKQGNQNAAALSPEEGIGKTRDFINCPIVQENGQRRYGPPRGWKSDPPPRGCEVFIGKIPRDCLEDELIPVFEQIGPIYMFRLMMEFNGSNRGYGFCVYTNREDTKRAVQQLDNYEIRKGKTIGVCFSVDNCRLFVGGIPKSKTREEIMAEMKRVTEGVKDVISYPSVNDKSKNRGFAFVEYESHKAAAMARRKLIPGRIQLWNQQIAVDWAEPEREVNEDIMSKVKILYVRNLMLSTTEESLREHFVKAAGGDPTCIERVKKITDYAFIHFKEREQAEICLNLLNDTTIDGSKIEVTWAKPVDKSEANIRQQSNQATNKLFGELDLSKELRSNNPLLIDPRTSSTLSTATGLLSHLDPSIPFMLSHVGQHAPITPDILPMNPTLPSSSGAAINIGSPGSSRLNGARNGRRNAAGSRSAGIQRDRKHPVEKLQQRQMNPFSFFELLEELSRNVGWGTPNFTVLPTDFVDTLTGNKFQLYIGQVYLPNLRLQYQSPRYYATPEEAKIGACEMAILHLQYHQVMSADDAKNLGRQPILPTSFPAYGALLSGSPVHFPMLPFSNTAVLDTQNPPTSGNCKTAHPTTKIWTASVSESSVSASCNQETGLGQTNCNVLNEPCCSSNSGSHFPQSSVASPSLLTTSTCTVPTAEASSRTDANEPSEVDQIEPNDENIDQPKSSGLICVQVESMMTASNAGSLPQLACSPAVSTSFGLHPVFTNNAHSFSHLQSTTFKPIPHSQLTTLHPSSYPACPVFAANYALALGANVLPSGAAYLPLQLSASGPSSNNALQLLQAQSGCLPMPANGNQTSAHPAMGLSHSPDSTAALAAMNGFDYSPAFLPGQMTAATLIAPLGNAPAYLFDPNCVSTAQAASMMVASGSSMPALPASTAACPAELIHSHTLGQTSAFPTTSMPHTGLYTLGLQQSTLQNPSSQLTLSPNSHNSLLGMISQQQPFQPTISSQVVATPNVSLQTAQTHTNQKVQSFLPVPAPV